MAGFLAAQSAGGPPGNAFAIPLLLRLPVAAAVAWWAGRTDRAWLVPVAVLLAMPAIWHATLSLLVGTVALLRRPELAPPGQDCADTPGVTRTPSGAAGRPG